MKSKYRRRFTDEELIAHLQAKAKELGRAPVSRDARRDPDMPDSVTYIKRFGSWNSAMKAAGFTPRLEGRHTYWTDEEILKGVKRFYDEHGRQPKWSECTQQSYLPNSRTINRRFGSLRDSFSKAGIKPKWKGICSRFARWLLKKSR